MKTLRTSQKSPENSSSTIEETAASGTHQPTLNHQTNDSQQPATDSSQPGSLLRRSPQPPPTPPSGPLTLNEQYVIAYREHERDPKTHRDALEAITKRLVAPTPEDLARDREIRAARAQADQPPLTNAIPAFALPGIC